MAVADAWCNISLAYRKLGLWGEAIAGYKEEIRLRAMEKNQNKQLAAAYRHLSFSLAMVSEWGESVKYLRKAFLTDPLWFIIVMPFSVLCLMVKILFFLLIISAPILGILVLLSDKLRSK